MTRVFATLLGATYIWVILTPIVPAVANAGMERFNLVTGSFLGWALQQPVPSMYNFANHGVIIPVNLEKEAVLVATNHFPTRRFTFEFRSAYIPSLPQVLLTSSSYQGRRVDARHMVEKAPDGGVVMRLLPAR